MDAKKWTQTIVDQTKACGTYKESFLPVIRTLADILEQRDLLKEEFESSGGNAIIDVRTDRGAEQKRINPSLKTWMDLNSQALVYWRDLGLTPAGLKKISESALKAEGKKESALEKALKALSG